KFIHAESGLKLQDGKDMLTSIMINSPEIIDIYIFDVNRSNSLLSSEINSVPDQWDSDWYQAILKANGSAVWFGLSKASYVKKNETGFPVFGLGRAIRSWRTGEIIGVMFFEIMSNALNRELSRVQFGDTGYLYVVNDQNRYFYHPNASLFGIESRYVVPKEKTAYQLDGSSTLIIPEQLDNGWDVVGVVPLAELSADSASIRKFTMWIALGCILLAIGIGYYATRRIGNPLVDLSRLMRKGEEGDLSVRSRYVGNNEIGQLGRSFNNMIARIDLLIEQIAKEESEKKKAEIRALRYQINPHFLYNTLNSIRWMAKLNRVGDVDKAITTLVHLLEGSLERKGVFIKLGDELELLVKYMIIQEYRYDNGIVLNIRCPDKLRQVPIPRMLLQPIVENAIFHGIAPKDEAGTIAIDVEETVQDIVIRITDDGVGIDEGRITQLLANDAERHSKGMTNIGLQHVHQTIQLYYGSGYGLIVSSKKNEGTEVRITISKPMGDKHVQSAVG
ncbi:histidine kinase, partial [Paenibacillus darwinianus]